MSRVEIWMRVNGYTLPQEDDLDDCTFEMKFKDLFELMEFYALQHQLEEYNKEINKILKAR